MNPKVILHNSISLDGSFLHLDVDMGLHYQTAASFEAGAHLIGSVTARTGLEMFGGKLPKEEKQDFSKPDKDKGLPYWVLVDSKGMLKGLLHSYRRFEFCRDVIVLISETTSVKYVAYLEERDYDYCAVGQGHVDLRQALEWLKAQYNIQTVLTDTGRTLADALLNEGLVDEISLLVCPAIVGEEAENLFGQVREKTDLKLIKHEVLEKNYLWLIYEVK